MGLFKKFFGRDKAEPVAVAASSLFVENETTTTEQGTPNAPRRELVQVVLRATMRMHGIPLDWIDCRILSVVSRSTKSGMHVHFIVHRSHERLLTYVPAFQISFMDAIEKFEPNAADWLMSLSWQFDRLEAASFPAMPDPGLWLDTPAKPPQPAASVAPVVSEALAGPVASVAEPVAEPTPEASKTEEDEVMQDLKALFAIRDAAFRQDGDDAPVDLRPTEPGR